MQARHVAWSIALGFGCGGTPSQRAPLPPQPPPVTHAPRGPATPQLGPDVTAAPPVAQVVESAVLRINGAAACTLRSEAWFGELSFTRDASPFASVIGANTTVLLPQAGTGMFVEIADGGIRIGTWAHSPILHLARSVVLSKVVYPRPAASVDWQGLNRTGAVAISLDVASALSEPLVARADVTCKDLAIEETSFKLPISIPSSSRAGAIILKDAAPLSTTPGGKSVATVQVSPMARLVRVGRRGAATLVVLDDPSFVVRGWISSSLIDEGTAPMMGYGAGIGSVGAKITLPGSENRGCVRDLPLFVEMAGSRAEVGALVAGSPYPNVTEKVDAAGYVGVEPYGRQWLVLAKGARLLVRNSDLSRCHTP